VEDVGRGAHWRSIRGGQQEVRRYFTNSRGQRKMIRGRERKWGIDFLKGTVGRCACCQNGGGCRFF